MTEPKQATWREFVEWLAWHREHEAKRFALMLAARDVVTRGEASILCLGVLGMGKHLIDRAMEDWTAELRFNGTDPPADPPSVVDVLERLSYQFDACESDAASASSSLAWKTAAKMARAKAKEFT